MTRIQTQVREKYLVKRVIQRERGLHSFSSHLTFTVQMKNWLPLVPGPALAMLSTPGPTCFTASVYSSQYGKGFQLTIKCLSNDRISILNSS